MKIFAVVISGRHFLDQTYKFRGCLLPILPDKCVNRFIFVCVKRAVSSFVHQIAQLLLSSEVLRHKAA